jgi:hypothetical protein
MQFKLGELLMIGAWAKNLMKSLNVLLLDAFFPDRHVSIPGRKTRPIKWRSGEFGQVCETLPIVSLAPSTPDRLPSQGLPERLHTATVDLSPVNGSEMILAQARVPRAHATSAADKACHCVLTSPDGTKEWRLDGKLHREDGPAIEYSNGAKYWYRDGQLHREDGPGFEGADGSKLWYRNGQLHREDGPAVEWPDGAEEWYLDGERVKQDEVLGGASGHFVR